MTSWEIQRCTVADAAGLARNSMSAFWEDPTWILLWPGITLEFLIEQATKRRPRELLRNREERRHQKAVDPDTGVVVGYARWVLPSGHTTDEGGGPAWTEALVPSVGDEEKKRFDELAESAWWKAKNLEGMDDENTEVMDRTLAEKPYIKLDYLAVHPENKGKGIATALVVSGIKYAEEARLPIFVMAYKAARGLYERLGFKEFHRIIQDDSKWGGTGEYGAYFMIYDITTVS